MPLYFSANDVGQCEGSSGGHGERWVTKKWGGLVSLHRRRRGRRRRRRRRRRVDVAPVRGRVVKRANSPLILYFPSIVENEPPPHRASLIPSRARFISHSFHPSRGVSAPSRISSSHFVRCVSLQALHLRVSMPNTHPSSTRTDTWQTKTNPFSITED